MWEPSVGNWRAGSAQPGNRQAAITPSRNWQTRVADILGDWQTAGNREAGLLSARNWQTRFPRSRNRQIELLNIREIEPGRQRNRQNELLARRMGWIELLTMPPSSLDAGGDDQAHRRALEILDALGRPHNTLTHFPPETGRPVGSPGLGNDTARDVILEPRLEFMNQRNLHGPAHEEQSRLTPDEQKAALQKLKKEVYNPVPRMITKRLNLYYRENAIIDDVNEKDEDGKACAICLEDFEPKEEVLLTPCGHMFHEDCIIPWAKSHGQCPICRLQFFASA